MSVFYWSYKTSYLVQKYNNIIKVHLMVKVKETLKVTGEGQSSQKYKLMFISLKLVHSKTSYLVSKVWYNDEHLIWHKLSRPWRKVKVKRQSQRSQTGWCLPALHASRVFFFSAYLSSFWSEQRIHTNSALALRVFGIAIRSINWLPFGNFGKFPPLIYCVCTPTAMYWQTSWNIKMTGKG